MKALTIVGAVVTESTTYVGCSVIATCRSPCGRSEGVATTFGVTFAPGENASINTFQFLAKHGTKPGSAILSIALDAASSDGNRYTHSVTVLARLPKIRPEVVVDRRPGP